MTTSDTSTAEQRARVWAFAALAAITLVAVLLRTVALGNVFQSSDNCELPVKILRISGYAWMARENYGVLINLLVKLFVGSASALGVTITEFWWKLPVALVGAMQPVLTYAFMRRLGCGRFGALASAAFMAALPVHVGQSRYTWGYETLGVFCVVLALWALVAFLQRPTLLRAAAASLAGALYLMSHGYILPFVPCFFITLYYFAPEPLLPPARRFLNALLLLARRGVWLAPLLAAPLYYHPLMHAFTKRTRPGFYLADHLPGFIGNAGLLLGVMMAAAALYAVVNRASRRRPEGLMALCGAFYLAPLVFGTPPDITVVRGYMLAGACFWLLCLGFVMDRAAQPRPRSLAALAALCCLVTLWSDVDTIFCRDAIFDPNLVTIERGDVPPDIGSKAAGCLVRKYLRPGARILALHRALEPPNLYYYAGRGKLAFFDLPLEAPFSPRRPRDTREAFRRFGPAADVVICEEAQLPYVAASPRFEKRVVLHSEGKPRMWIFARPGLGLPRLESADVRPLNRAFDREFAWKVPLW